SLDTAPHSLDRLSAVGGIGYDCSVRGTRGHGCPCCSWGRGEGQVGISGRYLPMLPARSVRCRGERRTPSALGESARRWLWPRAASERESGWAPAGTAILVGEKRAL